MGACVGEAMLGKKLGRRAMLLGALAQSIPDVDFVAAFWNDTASNLLAHRGFTHSILFDVLTVFLFAFIAEYFHRSHKVGYKIWIIFFAVQISLHLFVDLFNNYGVGLFEPFNHGRYSFNAIFVADPLFSIWPFISFVMLLVLKPGLEKRTFWWKFGLAGAFIYLSYCSFNKMMIETDVKKALVIQKSGHRAYLTTPAPLNNLLWYVAVQTDSGYFVGYRSVFDKSDTIDFGYFPRNDYLLKTVADNDELKKLKRFSQGYYTVEQWHDTIVFNDLRFGQIIGWHDPREKFVFHYFLQHPSYSNNLVVQRGRFAKWNRESIRSLLERIRGN